MTLLFEFFNLTQGWKQAFSQKRTHDRAIRQSVASLCGVGRNTLTRAIHFAAREQFDWSGEYKLHSRASWEISGLFLPIFHNAIPLLEKDLIAVAYDDTKIKKTGRKIESASMQRDPLSPPYHVNLMLGLRFLHAALLVPLYNLDRNMPPRALPLQFIEVPIVKKPGKKATPEDWSHFRKLKKEKNLSAAFLQAAQNLRSTFDDVGAGSFQERCLT